MRKSVTVLAATPFLVFALASCSSSSSTPTNTTPETPQASVQASENAQKVADYCAKVDELEAEAKELKANPNADQAKVVAQKATDLTTQAQTLAGAVLAEPELTAQVTDCSNRLQSVATG